MANAKSSKSPDPNAPDPNDLEMMPTGALVDELIRRSDGCVIVYRFDDTRVFWRVGEHVEAMGLLSYASHLIHDNMMRSE